MNKNNSNKLYEKNPFLVILFLNIAFFLFPLLIIFAVCYLIVFILPEIHLEINFLLGIITVPVSLVTFIIYKNSFGFYKSTNSFNTRRKYDLLFISIIILFMLLFSIIQFNNITLRQSINWSLFIDNIGSALFASTLEELFFRGILISYLSRKYAKNSKCIQYVVLISTFLFGLAHFINLFFNNVSFSDVIKQFFVVFCLGFFLCSLYLKTSHLWSCIIIHFLWNLFIFFSSSSFLITTTTKHITFILFLAFELFMVLFAYLILKKEP